MELIGWYILFAATTSVVAHFELVKPVITELSDLSPDNNMIQYKYIGYFVFLLVDFLIAPFIFFSCLVPSWGNRFRAALLESLRKV